MRAIVPPETPGINSVTPIIMPLKKMDRLDFIKIPKNIYSTIPPKKGTKSTFSTTSVSYLSFPNFFISDRS